MSLLPVRSPFDMSDIFDNFSMPTLRKEFSDSFFSPRVDITENKDHYEIVADLPGVDKKDLKVSLEDGILKIEASKSEEKTEKEKGKIIRQERSSGTYMRSFNLGSDVKEKDINAKFKDGVLTLKAPKSNNGKSNVKMIDVK